MDEPRDDRWADEGEREEREEERELAPPEDEVPFHIPRD